VEVVELVAQMAQVAFDIEDLEMEEIVGVGEMALQFEKQWKVAQGQNGFDFE